MKLKQFHNSKIVTCRITDTSLIINIQGLFSKKVYEILFENILIKDKYVLEYRDKSLLVYTFLSVFFFGISAEHSFQTYLFEKNQSSHSLSDWVFPIVFGLLTVINIVRFFITRRRILIPTKGQGLIKLFQKQPDKKSVDEFIYALEGRINLMTKKRPEKTDLKEFIAE